MMLDEVATYCAANGIGSLAMVGSVLPSLFIGFRPDEPDSLVCLNETAGSAPYRVMGVGQAQVVAERPRLQVICRGPQHEYIATRQKAAAVQALLEGLGSAPNTGLTGIVLTSAQNPGGTRYLWIASVGSAGLMGRDDAGRVLIVQNYDVVKEISPS